MAIKATINAVITKTVIKIDLNLFIIFPNKWKGPPAPKGW
jgi:hypothetical protein